MATMKKYERSLPLEKLDEGNYLVLIGEVCDDAVSSEAQTLKGNELKNLLCGIRMRVEKGIIRVSRPEPIDNMGSIDYENMDLPRQKPFMEVALKFLHEVNRVGKDEMKRVVVEDYWGWGTEYLILKPIYEANGFNPIHLEIENESVMKTVREINARLNDSSARYHYDICMETTTHKSLEKLTTTSCCIPCNNTLLSESSIELPTKA